MYKHIALALFVALCIYLASIQQQPEDDYRYEYVDDEGWRCTLTIHTDECHPIDSEVGGRR